MDIPTLYCEQLGLASVQWANIFSNLVFIFVAIALVVYFYKKKETLALGTKILSFLLALIGLGSLAWHLSPAPWSDLVDTLSIVLFAATALYGVLGFFIKKTFVRVGMLGALLVAAFYIEQLPQINGSLVYLFLLGLLFVASLLFFRKKSPAGYRVGKILLWTSLLFSLAILARSIDPALCSAFPLGTHFLWHILVAGVGGLLVVGISKAQ